MSTAANSLFGRKYSLQVKSAPANGSQTLLTISDSSFEPEALRITFDVVTSAWQTPWYAEICIYNPNEQTAAILLGSGQNQGSTGTSAGAGQPPIEQGMEVILSAGYQNKGNYGVIWDGFVLQPLWERENQTDFKITLHCMTWLGIVTRNNVQPQAFGAGATQQQIVQGIMRNSFHAISPGTVSSDLGTKKLPRGKVVFGSPAKYLSEIARDNDMQWWLDKKGLANLGTPKADLSASVQSAKVYTAGPGGSIVGTPQQTQDGVNFDLLLDPTVEVKLPYQCVKIDNTQIRQLLKQVGVLPSLLAQDGVYVVMATRYVGDTRGNHWYTKVTGWLTANAKLAATSDAAGAWLGNG